MSWGLAGGFLVPTPPWRLGTVFLAGVQIGDFVDKCRCR